MIKSSGIYIIRNKLNGKIYCGSAKNLWGREKEHFKSLRENHHHNIKLQRAFNKYKEESFEFIVLILCKPEDLLRYEQVVLDKGKCTKDGYNILPTAGSMLGYKLTQEHKRKISEGNKGR